MMRNIVTLLNSILVCLVTAGLSVAATQVAAADSAAAAMSVDSVSRGRLLRITSDPPGARVYRDTVFLGTTPLEAIPFGPGIGRLRIVGGDPGSWFTSVLMDSILDSISDSLRNGTGDTIARHYEFPIAARIASDPAGAEVFLGDSLLGTTPLFAAVPRIVTHLTLRKAGYQPQTVLLHSGMSGYRAQLISVDPSGGPKPSYLSGEVGKIYTSVFIASGSAVVAGAAAAWLKNRADRHYEEYRLTGDGGTLDRVRRCDLFSGIALAATEISLGYLVIELLSR